MGEVDKIRERYDRRLTSDVDARNETYLTYNFLAQAERDLRFAEATRRRFDDLRSLKVLEVGAGNGNNLLLFRRLGVRWENLYASELQLHPASEAEYNLPGGTVLPGDALELPYANKFDVVVQSTVFTSILDDGFKQRFATKLLELAKEDGIVLWYDFKFDNPRNPDVKGIGKDEIRTLFAAAGEIEFAAVTLAPPIGRRVGRAYGIVNGLAPFLRSHLVAVIEARRGGRPRRD
jgi:SAM-dependent methyltransferase